MALGSSCHLPNNMGCFPVWFTLLCCILNFFALTLCLMCSFKVNNDLDTWKSTDFTLFSLCAINIYIFSINLQLSLLISSFSSFCNHMLQISPLPVMICSIRSDYFSRCFFFFTVVLNSTVQKGYKSFLVCFFLSFWFNRFNCLLYTCILLVRFVRVSDVLPMKNWCGETFCFIKLFCFDLSAASEQISHCSKLISLLPRRD